MTFADLMQPPRPDRSLRGLLVAVFVAAAVFAGRAAAAGPQGAEAKPAEQQSVSVEQETRPSAKKRTVLRFGEDDIHGDITRPDGELVQAPRKPAQPSLLRVRRNFLDRALSGAQRGR